MNFSYDQQAADRACQFFEDHLQHVEGPLAGQPFRLEAWQRKIVADLFGWKRPNGTRRYRTAYVEVPRKNGKSTLAAGLALYLLLADREAGAQVYSAAGDRGQARIVFDAARKMIEANNMLTAETDCYQNRIVGKRGNGFYTSLSAEAYSKHGFSASGIIFDELHVQPNRELWDVLTTSVGARLQPLTVAITTAGYDRSSICWELHERAKSAIAEPEADPFFYPVIFGADDGDDWTTEATWSKANPNYGVSLTTDFMREKCDEAMKSPSFENTFKRLHLNLWTQQDVRWLPMAAWDACRDAYAEGDLIGQRCFAGLDLASTRDVNALVLYFPESNRLLPYFWVPEDTHDHRMESDRRQILNWCDQRLIKKTPGNVTDYAVIVGDIMQIASRFKLENLAYDPWGPATAIVQQLQSEGWEEGKLTEYRQGYSSMAAPTKEFERLVVGGKLKHDGNAVLRWMAGNVTAIQDAAGNIKPDKSKSADKIDGIVAAIMCIGMSMKFLPQVQADWYVPGQLAL